MKQFKTMEEVMKRYFPKLYKEEKIKRETPYDRGVRVAKETAIRYRKAKGGKEE